MSHVKPGAIKQRQSTPGNSSREQIAEPLGVCHLCDKLVTMEQVAAENAKQDLHGQFMHKQCPIDVLWDKAIVSNNHPYLVGAMGSCIVISLLFFLFCVWVL